MTRMMKFREKLLALMHITSEQFDRDLEILSCRHINTTRDEQRNIFVKREMMMYVTRYHKEYSMTKNIKVIHRYLLREMRKLLM